MRLKQILLNLLSNSIKFTNKGKIILRVEKIRCNELMIAIEDTGIGISEYKLKQLDSLLKNPEFTSTN